MLKGVYNILSRNGIKGVIRNRRSICHIFITFYDMLVRINASLDDDTKRHLVVLEDLIKVDLSDNYF